MTTRTSRPTKRQIHHLHAAFLQIVPRIEQHGRIYFRNVRCPDRLQECLAEMVALSWRWFVRLAHKGKDASRFPSALASFAARAVRSGRRLCGQEKAKDVLSPRAQQHKGFAVCKLPDFSTLSDNPLTEALTDNTMTPPDEQAAFRCDFPAWLDRLDKRRRRIVLDLMYGDRTSVVAHRHQLSAARISQLRREFHDDWDGFCA